jgi:hypothetical protein
MALIHLPAKMRRSTKFTRAQPYQREASGSTRAHANRRSPPELMEDDEEERVTQEAIARGEEPVCSFTLAC